MHSFAPLWNPLAKNGEKGPGQNNPEKEENAPFSNLNFSLKIAEILADFYKTFAKFTNILLNLLFFGNFELIFQKF